MSRGTSVAELLVLSVVAVGGLSYALAKPNSTSNAEPPIIAPAPAHVQATPTPSVVDLNYADSVTFPTEWHVYWNIKCDGAGASLKIGRTEINIPDDYGTVGSMSFPAGTYPIDMVNTCEGDMYAEAL